jgi:hypothetical protein
VTACQRLNVGCKRASQGQKDLEVSMSVDIHYCQFNATCLYRNVPRCLAVQTEDTYSQLSIECGIQCLCTVPKTKTSTTRSNMAVRKNNMKLLPVSARVDMNSFDDAIFDLKSSSVLCCPDKNDINIHRTNP